MWTCISCIRRELRNTIWQVCACSGSTANGPATGDCKVKGNLLAVGGRKKFNWLPGFRDYLLVNSIVSISEVISAYRRVGRIISLSRRKASKAVHLPTFIPVARWSSKGELFVQWRDCRNDDCSVGFSFY